MFADLKDIKWALVSTIVAAFVGAVGTLGFIALVRSGIAHGMY